MVKSNKPNPPRFRALLMSMIILLLMPMSALAYLDPTTGSMLISAIVGLFASLVLAVKTYWYRIKSFFKRKPPESNVDDGTV